MVTGSIPGDYTSTVALNRLWKAVILDIHNLMPKIAPELVKSVELIEGDGGAGTIKKFTFTDECAAVKGFNFVTNRVDVLDADNHVIKWSVVKGGLVAGRLKSYNYEFKFETASDGSGTIGKVVVEYETANSSDLSEEEKGEIMQGVFAMVKAVDGYLLANLDAYA